MMGRRRRSQAGFTLVESATALFVFAVAAVAVLELNTQNARAMQQLESAVYARIVADNQMALALGSAAPLERGAVSGEEALSGRAFAWSRVVAPTVDPDIDRVDVVVTIPGESRVAASLSGFRGRR
jgi:general secretion pathway protein I